MRPIVRLLALVLVAAPAAIAQPTSPDWDTRPAVGPAPAFVPPAVERHELSNGLPVLFVPKPGVPLVEVDLLVKVGAVDDPAGREGLAVFMADMMDEGAGDLSALELADAVDFLGVDLGVGAGRHDLSVRLRTPVSKLDESLGLLAAVALRPTFPQADLERLRTQQLTAFAQRRDEPGAISGVITDRTLFGDAHPYGRPAAGTPAAVAALTRDDLADFHATWVRPWNAALVVVGDVAWDDIADRLEGAFGNALWPTYTRAALGAQDPPRAVVAEPAPVGARAVTIVDKPGAAQSVVRIGRIGAARATPDVYALDVLNTILGGSFTSRLNQNIRETNGYAYGAGSSFDFRPVPGPFLAGADVQTDVTGPALTEFFRELTGILETIPDDEVEKARNYVALSFPAPFATVRGTAAMVGDLFLNDLPADTYARYAERILAVTADDLARVARTYITPDQMAVVIVGDRAAIEAEVRALGLGPVTVLSIDDVLGE